MENHYVNQEFLRRNSLILGQQLEFLRAEGGISSDDYNLIIKYHPLTVTSVEKVTDVPQRNPEYVSQIMSYTEACASLLKRVLGRISDFQTVSKEIEPKGMGTLEQDDFPDFSLDLLIAILLTRNQSLQTYFEGQIVHLLEEKCESILAMCYGEDAVELYNHLKLKWAESIQLSELPHIEVSKILMDRMKTRLPNKERFNPFLSTGIGEILVVTECYYWRIVSMCAILKED